MDDVKLTVSEFVDLTNQTLEYAYPSVAIEGEVSEYKVIQGKWVSFKIKDDAASVSCFCGVYQMRTPLEDGMRVIVVAAPRLNNKGYFTLNIRSARPVGEGSIKKGFELLKAKLEKEGLFSPERKRALPVVPSHIAVITSTESAAYADFVTILNQRWGGMDVEVAHTQVQGVPAADQIIRAITYFNSLEVLPEVLVIIRGGGSAEDLSSFNDEPLARAIAASRIPTLVGVGHEIDHTLADMVSDVRAATPTNAAQIIVPDRRDINARQKASVARVGAQIIQEIDHKRQSLAGVLERMQQESWRRLEGTLERWQLVKATLDTVNPQRVLERGYAVLRGSPVIGQSIEIERAAEIITAEVNNVRQK